MGIMSVMLKNASRVAKVTPDFLLGTSAEVMGPAMRGAKGSLFTKAKAGFRALEADVAAQRAVSGGFFKRTWKNLISTPKSVATGTKAGFAAAKTAGKSGIWGAIKGGGKAIAKKMPFIGAALTVAIEAPNIIKAFKDGGFQAGMKEVGGAGVELGCMAGGAAIGSCFGPVGTLVGGLIGGIVGMFTRGKTYSEKKAEQEAQGAVQYSEADIQQLRQYGMSDEEIALAQQNGYTVQDIEALIAQQIKENENQIRQYEVGTGGLAHPEISDEVAELRRQNEILRAELEKRNGNSEVVNTNYPNPYMPGLYNPYMTGLNPTNMQNLYTNDILYQQLFGGVTNPYDIYNQGQFRYVG